MQKTINVTSEENAELERQVAAGRHVRDILEKVKEEKVQAYRRKMGELEGKYNVLVLENAMIYEDVRSTAVQTKEKYYKAVDTITELTQRIDFLINENKINETKHRQHY